MVLIDTRQASQQRATAAIVEGCIHLPLRGLLATFVRGSAPSVPRTRDDLVPDDDIARCHGTTVPSGSANDIHLIIRRKMAACITPHGENSLTLQ